MKENNEQSKICRKQKVKGSTGGKRSDGGKDCNGTGR